MKLFKVFGAVKDVKTAIKESSLAEGNISNDPKAEKIQVNLAASIATLLSFGIATAASFGVNIPIPEEAIVPIGGLLATGFSLWVWLKNASSTDKIGMLTFRKSE